MIPKIQYWVGLLLFLICISDLSEDLKFDSKHFCWSHFPSLFYFVQDINLSQKDLNEDLAKTNNWEYQWKMICNPNHSNQGQEIIFNWKVIKPLHLPLIFNNSDVAQINCQKNLGMILDSRLRFRILELQIELRNWVTYNIVISKDLIEILCSSY